MTPTTPADIAAWPAVQEIGAPTAIQLIIPNAPEELISTSAAIQTISTLPASQLIVAVAPVDDVDTTTALQNVIPGITKQRV